MRASAGDTLIIHGRIAGQPDRRGEVLDVRGVDGQPPYQVRFDDGHEALIFPGSDVEVLSGG